MSRARNLPDNVIFMVYVLWMHGFSLARVASEIERISDREVTRFQIRSILRGTPYEVRQSMSVDERQRHLDMLKENRMDRGRIREYIFQVRKLKGE